MILKIPALQIPNYWELIKFAGVKADGIADKDISRYAIELLLKLLDGTYGALLSFNKDKSLNRVLIYEFYQDKITDEKVVQFKIMYSFNHASKENWDEESVLVYEFAKTNNCDLVRATIRSDQLMDITDQLGGTVESKNYYIKL